VTAGPARLHAGDLDGVEKAAALLLAMGRPLASRLVKHFDEPDLRRLTQAAVSLPATSPSAIEALVDDFARSFAIGPNVVGDVEQARGLLEEALPAEKVSDIMADVVGAPKASFWARAASLPDPRLLAFLEAEHPQVTAYLLARFETPRTAGLLSLLSPRRRDQAAERIIGLRRLPARAQHLTEAALEGDLLNVPADEGGERPEARLIEIAAQLERGKLEELIEALEPLRPDVVKKLREKMFAFDDIVLLTQRERMLIFDKTPTESLILALKDTSEEFREVVLSSLAARARRMVEAELKNADTAQDKDVALARATIERVVVELIEGGMIQRPGEGESMAA
jgi:flagellar motor switch protein FliG